MQIASDRVMRPRESGNSMAGRKGRRKEGRGARPESEVEAEKVAFKVSFYESRERREETDRPVHSL